MYIFACVSLRCVECRAGTSIFGPLAGVGGGTVPIFYFPGSVLAGTVRLKWWGGMIFLSFFFQFFVNSLGERICAVGILRYTSCSIL